FSIGAIGLRDGGLQTNIRRSTVKVAVITNDKLPNCQLPMTNARLAGDTQASVKSIAIVLWLIGAIHRNAEIAGLLFGERGELDADLFQVQAGVFFVQLLGQAINSWFVKIFVRSEIQLRENLIRGRV